MYIQKLTDYQKEILHLNRTGLTQKEIATKLGSSQQSVSSAIASVRRKGYEVIRHYKMIRKVPNPSVAETPSQEARPQEPKEIPKVIQPQMEPKVDEKPQWPTSEAVPTRSMYDKFMRK